MSERMVDDGRLTLLGFWTYFVLQPVIFGSVGAISGLVGWLVAFGPRLAAPLRARPDR